MENAKSYLLNFVVSLVQRFCNKSNAAVSYCFRKNSYTHLVCIDCEDSLKDEFYAERMKFVIEFAEKFGEDIIFTSIDSGLCSKEEWEEILKDEYIVNENKVSNCNIGLLLVNSHFTSDLNWTPPVMHSSHNRANVPYLKKQNYDKDYIIAAA